MLSTLRHDQKEAVGLLQIGTFLEYFDLMLYVHMAVILNEIFFPATDAKTAALLSAFSFCSTYLTRPFAAVFFGYIGDYIGRKATVTITTMAMAISCIVMANLPTYAQIGISASWAVTICRIVQGFSSLGEVIGAEIYLTEITKPPVRHPAVSLIAVSCALGSMVAICLAAFVTMGALNWRIAFWVGALIAIVGSLARTKLRETPDFVDMKRRMKKVFEAAETDGLSSAAQLLKQVSAVWKEKVSKKTMLAYFLIYCGWPACFYFSYIYCGDILKNTFYYTAEQVIHQNLIVSVVHFFGFLFFALASYKIHPLKLLKWRLMVFLPFICLCPYLLQNPQNGISILWIQSISIFFSLTNVPASGVFVIHFPVLKRFTYTSFIYAFTRAATYVVTSFSLVYLTELFGYWGLLLILVPISLGFLWGVSHFEFLERMIESFPSKKLEAA